MTDTTAPRGGARETSVRRNTPVSADWWRRAVIYQIYPRSFADSNGDGIGDLVGITGKVPYLASLGIDAVWLSPFYPSALADGGYDVDDHRAIDPRIGTDVEFIAMVEAFHGANIAVMVDIVPNHTSDRHRWFRAALEAGPGSPERNRYIFRDGRGEDGREPPNAWPSHFGPSCWKRVPDGQWYLHLFAPEQPDLNWENPEVHADAIQTLMYWAGRGVDGFRVDAAHCLAKDLDAPVSHPKTVMDLTRIPTDGSHPFFDRDAVHEIYREWRRVFAAYDPPLVAVAEAPAPFERREQYEHSLGQVFTFEMIQAPWDARAMREAIAPGIRHWQVTGAPATWALTNHDLPRQASRYGLPADVDLNAWLMSGGTQPPEDRTVGLSRARAAAMLALALPGTVYLYAGEELGLFEVADLPADTLADPMWVRSGHTVKGRDGCRVPLPWSDSGPSFGFSSASVQLPQPEWFSSLSVAFQESTPESTLRLYRAAICLRRTFRTFDTFEWLSNSADDLLHFARGNGWQCMTNMGAQAVLLPECDVLLASGPTPGGMLPPDTTVWFTAP